MLLKTKKRELTEEENNFKIALSMAGISGEDKTLVQAFKLSKAVTEKGGSFSLKDAVQIEAEVKALYPEFPEVIEKETKKEEETLTDETVKTGL